MADATRVRPASRPPESPTDISRAGWRSIARRAFQQVKHDQLTDSAAALTYFGVLSIFPALIALVSVLGMLGHATVQKFMTNVDQLAPGGVRSFLQTVVQQVEGRHTTAGIAAVVGVLVAIWSASRYVAAFGRAMNNVYGVDEGRPAWRTLPVRVAVTVALLVLLVASVVIVVVTGSIATQVGQAIGIGNTGRLVWDIAKWPVLVVLVSVMFSLLYWATPNVKQPGFRWITPGGVFAVVFWLVASGLFAVYAAFSSSYNKTYGALASVIVFLVWLWLSNLSIMLGAEFNAELERQRLIAAGMPADVDPYVDVRDTRKLPPEERQRVLQAAAVRERTLGRAGS
jgi:membrane protein